MFVYDKQGLLLSDGECEFVYLGNIPVAMTTTERKNEVLQIHTDHLGTPRAVTNVKNEKLWQWEGEAFGDSKPQIETIKQPLRFAGQYADDEVGLFYNYFRFYNPETGRYIENDPIDLQGGLNRYGYVGGSPLHAVDPYGLLGIGAKTGAIAGGVVGGILGGIVCIPTGPFALACGAEGATIGATAGFAFGMAVGNLSDVIGEWIKISEANQQNQENIAESESCPSTEPENWEKIPGSNQAYRPKGAKEPIFEKDRAGDRGHGGSAWKKWDKAKDWQKGKDRNGTYSSDGVRLRD